MKQLLIIDPGHGGKDPGGGSNQFWKEKDKVLEISLYQEKRFKDLSIPVVMTRNEDIYLNSTDRTRIVRESGAKYCISNHINAGGGDGAEVIYSIYGNQNIAEGIAAEINREGQNIRRVFTRTYPGNEKTDYYYMHRETGSVNTFIVEYGFADSKKDDIEQIKNDWEEYAESVIRAFCQLLGYKYIPPDKNVSEVSKWATDAHEFVMQNGISDGKNPKQPVTREEMWTMLYRLSQLKG